MNKIDTTDNFGFVTKITNQTNLLFIFFLFFLLPESIRAQAPVISYTPLTNTCTEGSRSLIATITSPQGVPTSGSGLPVLYWNFNSGSEIAVQGVYLGNNQYSFTLGAGVAAGSVVSYYIVAQNSAAVPEVSVLPSNGASGFGSNPPSVTTAPTNKDFYVIQTTLAAGTYLVGSGQVYTTITDAVNAYNNSCLSGAVTFLLTDINYSVNESFPITISNSSASSINTLTIKPNTNINATISGSAEAIFKYNGADYIIIDGSNNNTNSRNLTIQNNSLSPTASVFWLSSFSVTNGSTFNTIKNCNIYGANANSFAGIAVSSGVMVSSNAEASNNNNSFVNNNINTAYYGIYINGVPSNESGNQINQNIIGSTIAGRKIGYRSVFVANQTNVSISANTIVGVSSSVFIGAEADASGGIFVAGSCTGGEISRNLIYDIKNTNTAGAASYGISLQSSTNASNLRVHNNMIHSVVGYGKPSSVIENGIGISVLSGGGYGIYYNSVLLQVNSNVPGISTCIYLGNSISGTVDLRNNIFSNRLTQGTRYAIYCNAPRSIFNVINYNDYNSLGYLGFIAGDQYQNIGQWQGATLADGGSVAVDPIFFDATNANLSLVNLHLQNASPLNDQGNPVTGITIDFDGNTRSASNPDIGADEFTPPPCTGNFGGNAILASSSFICVSGTAVLTCAGFSFGSGIAYQWQSSTDNVTWINVSGETNPTTANPTSITVTTYFRLRVVCAAGTPGYSNTVIITVKNPAITSTVPASRCGTGTVTLSANANSGTTVQWYNTATGGAPISSGNSFVTPALNTSTTYYAEPAFIGSSGNCGPVSPSAVSTDISYQLTPWNVYFDVLNATTLASVDVFPAAVGDAFSIEIYNSGNVLIGSSNFVTNVSGGNTVQTIPLNIFLQPGSDYYMYINPGESGQLGFGLNRNISGAAYPYVSADIVINGNAFNNSYYMCFYNWKYTNGCTVSRVPVLATVSQASEISVTATPLQICGGGSTTLTASSTNPGYVYTWTPGGFTGASVSVSPAVSTRYTVNGTDGTCANSKFIDVFVDAPPTPINISPNAPLFCLGSGTVALSTSGGSVSSSILLQEKFEGNGLPAGWDTTNSPVNSLGKWTKRTSTYVYGSATVSTTAFKSNDSSKFFMANSDAQRTGTLDTRLKTPKLNLTGYTGATLSFWHHYNPFIAPDSINVEKSKNGITGWISLYRAGPSTSAGTSVSAPIGSSVNFTQKIIDLTPFLNNTPGYVDTFYIRFRYVGKQCFYWAIDNVTITGSGGSPITWNPPTRLFTNTAGTIPYVAGSFATTVYAAPNTTTTYTASSVSPNGCAATANVTVNVKPLVSAVISGTTSICPGGTAQLTVSLTGTPPWRITYTNGTTPVIVSGITSSPFVFNVSPSSTTTYSLTAVQDGNSCFASTSNVSGSALVSVRAVSASFSGTTSICPGSSVILPVTLTGTPPWRLTYFNGSTNTTITGITSSPYNLVVQPVQSTTYSISSLTDSTGCIASTNSLGGSYVVYVRQILPSEISGTSVICPGISTPLYFNLSGNPPWNITYSNGISTTTVNGITSSPYTTFVTPNLSSTYILQSVTDGNGCVHSPSTLIGSASITVSPVVTGNISGSTTICGSNSAQLIFTLTGTPPWKITYDENSGPPIVVTDVTSSPFVIPVNPTATSVYTLLNVNDNAGCSIDPSNISGTVTVTVTSSMYNLWNGITRNWEDAINWCSGVPGETDDIYIPSNVDNFPLVNSQTAAARDIILEAGSTLTVKSGGALNVKGNFTNDGIIYNYGLLKFTGNTPQHFPGGAQGTIAYMNELEIDKASLGADGDFVFDKSIDFADTGVLRIKDASNVLLQDKITMKSSELGSARIDSIGSRAVISYIDAGAFTVERFIPAGITHNKSWQLLSTPTRGQTINQSWQEGALGLYENPMPGYGTTITSDLTGATSSLGFDFFTPIGPSLKVYQSGTNNYVGVPGTLTVPVYNSNGYMFLVRGDRSVTSASTPAVPVILRTTGSIVYGEGADMPEEVTLPVNGFQCIGNPYASPIDFVSLMNTSQGLTPNLYLWDPTLSSYYGLGGFQTFSDYNNWEPIPGDTYNYNAFVSNTVIQSGQAFFAYSDVGGVVRFKEQNKVSGRSNFFRNQMPNQHPKIRVNLLNSSGRKIDACLWVIDSLSNEQNDVPKLKNFGENIFINSENKNLVIDARRTLLITDTIHYKINNLRQQEYILHFVPSFMEGIDVTALLVDQYSGWMHPVSLVDTSVYSFIVNSDPQSYAEGRFYMIFVQQTTLSSMEAELYALANESIVDVNWHVENETNVIRYEVERSVDGRYFTQLGIQNSNCISSNNCDYSMKDMSPDVGINYYRLKIVKTNGRFEYTNVVKVFLGEQQSAIVVYPNPVQSNKLSVKFIKMSKGNYNLMLRNEEGRLIHKQFISHSGIDTHYLINPSQKLSSGIYLLQTISEKSETRQIKVTVIN